MSLIHALINVSIEFQESVGSEYFMSTILPAVLSVAASSIFSYFLGKSKSKRTTAKIENENFKNLSKFDKLYSEAIEHVSLAHSYEDRGNFEKSSDELENACDYLLKASVYVNSICRNRLEILADSLVRHSRILRKINEKSVNDGAPYL